jgi:hypothetical protein
VSITATRVKTAALFGALSMVTCTACSSCRKKSPPGEGPDGGAVTDASSIGGALEVLPRFERFIDARLRDDGDVDVAGVTRDNRLVLARARLLPDGTLEARGIHPLADDFVATEETSVVLARGGLVVALGKLGGRAGNWLVGTSSLTPREIGEDWCASGGGVAWLAREEGGARVFYVHAGVVDVASGLVGAAPDAEVHLACGPDALVVSVGDGEDLTLARLHPGTPAFTVAPPLVVMEKEGELEDELRERFVVARGGDDVVVVRVGERKVWMRELVGAATAPTPWSTLATTKESGAPGKAFRLDADADVIDVEASSGSNGASPVTWLLASEPMKGNCKSGDPPRRIVLHSLKAGIDPEPGSETRRPIVELACGVEAIAAHLGSEGDVARMWWSEPIADGSCAFPGLAVGAAIEATSDKPGARRHALIAEGVARIAEGRFVAVVREGGCASYDAPGNGALKWIGNP